MALPSSSEVYTGSQFLDTLETVQRVSITPHMPPQPLPKTSQKRLSSSEENTILYLAYGSNLCSTTFRGARGIKPLSSLPVIVPSLRLTFDLPGIPYIEPCFANTAYNTSSSPTSSPYRKDRWTKGLIGVVYEVTPADYRTIIATEGGGASYQDVVVECYSLPLDTPIVNPIPTGAPFKAHTLLQPRKSSSLSLAGPQRPDPSYAQASQRYLSLLTTGAEEHNLPAEYVSYLYQMHPYTITTRRQQIGKVLFVGIWMPMLLPLIGLSKVTADKEGRVPKWLATIMGWVFKGLWACYDGVFKKAFGDGERTEGDDGEEGVGNGGLGMIEHMKKEKGRIRLGDEEKGGL